MRYHYNCTCGYSATYETDRTAPETIACNKCKAQVTRKAEKVKEPESILPEATQEAPQEAAQKPARKRGRPRKQ